MAQSLTSQRIRVPTRQKSQSISEIQHQPLRVSFSILSILQPEDNLSSHEKQLKSFTTRQEQQFNKEYLPLPKKYQKYKNSISSKVKHINLKGQKSKKQDQYMGEYFQSTQILTPKMNSNQFYKVITSSNKSSKKDLSTKKDKSKSICKSKQKSTKSIQSNKKISNQFNFLKRHEKSPSNYNLKFVNSPYNHQEQKNPSKGKLFHHSKSEKEIVVICHDKNLYKPKKMIKNQIQKAFNKENLVFNKQNIFPKKSVSKKQSKSKPKNALTAQFQQYKSQKNIPHFSSDYWSCGLEAISKSRSKHQRLSKNSELKNLKQKLSPY